MPIRLIAFALSLVLFAVNHAHADTLHRGNIAEPGSLDLQKYLLTYEAEILRDLFVGLLTIDAHGDPIPGLAESWKPNQDGTVWTFTLRKNILWSDGTPIVADDAVFGIRRGMDPATQSNYANLAYNIKNAEAVNKLKMKPEALGVRAIDPRTVEITLEKPSPILPLLLSNIPMLYPAPKHAILKNPKGWAKAGTMVSSGAYTLANWRPSDYVRLIKNPKFYDAANVAIDEVKYYPTVDDGAALNQFRAGQLDINTRFPPNQIDWLKKNLPAETRVHPACWITYLVPNHRRKPFNDARVRRALALAIERDVLTGKVLKNGEVPFAGIVPSVIAGYGAPIKPDARPLEQRQTEARALLAAAGFTPASPLKFTFSHRAGLNNRLAAVAVADMWKRIGVKAELLQSEVAVHYARLTEGDFELADAGWSGNLDPEFFTYLVLTDSKEINYGAYSNKTFDRNVESAKAILDQTKRFAAFAATERMAVDDNAIIPLFLSVNRELVKPYLKGVVPNPLGEYPTRFMRIEGRGK
jgi:oligopeptide transport system substrate-binding protein